MGRLGRGGEGGGEGRRERGATKVPSRLDSARLARLCKTGGFAPSGLAPSGHPLARPLQDGMSGLERVRARLDRIAGRKRVAAGGFEGLREAWRAEPAFEKACGEAIRGGSKRRGGFETAWRFRKGPWAWGADLLEV